MWWMTLVRLVGYRRLAKAAAVLVVGLTLVGVLGVMFVVAAVSGTTAAAAAPVVACTQTVITSQPTAPPSGSTKWSAEQIGNARIITARGQAAQVGPNGVIAALMTAMQESTLRNLPGGDRDSLGLFQQRPSQGWGTPVEILDPVKASDAFYGVAAHTANPGVLDIKDWQSLPLGVLSQAVQRSAYPTLYDRWEPDARALAQQLLSGADPTLDCTGSTGPAQVSGEWAHPLAPASFVRVSPFGMRLDPKTGVWKLHKGLDMAVPTGTPDRAACDGVIERVDPSDPYGGGMQTDLDCGGGVLLKYMHQSAFQVKAGDQVKAGQVIGNTGTTGHSTGPHLHFQVNVNGTAIEPVEFMRVHGITL